MLLSKHSILKRSASLVFGVSLIFGLAGCGAPAASSQTGTVVATYKGGEIKQSEMDKQYNIQLLLYPNYPTTNQFKENFLKEYITLYKVIEPEAKKENIQIDKTKIDSAVQDFKQQLLQGVYQNNQTALNDQMKKLNLTDKDIRNLAIDTMYIKGFYQEKVKDVKVTDDQLKKYYQDHIADFTDVTVDQILVKTEAEAKNVEAQLKSGTDFSTLAKKVSIDPSVKDNGGQFKDVAPSQFVDEFKNACMTLPIGKISDPVHTQFGYHIIKVESRYTFPIEQTKDKALEDAQNAAWEDFFQKNEQSADIKVTLPAEKPSDQSSTDSKQPGAVAPSLTPNSQNLTPVQPKQ